jgi:hypothetical protein
MRAANEIGQEVRAQRVTYVDEKSYHGNVGPFVKSNVYSHQVEFRVVLRPGVVHPVCLHISDIRDITVTGEAKDLPERLAFDPKTGQLMVRN